MSGVPGRYEERDPGRPWRDAAIGILVVSLEHFAVGGCLAGLGWLNTHSPNDVSSYYYLIFWGLGLGLFQLAYVGPTFLIALVLRRGVAAGVALGAVLTFLLNGACYGAFIVGGLANLV